MCVRRPAPPPPASPLFCEALLCGFALLVLLWRQLLSGGDITSLFSVEERVDIAGALLDDVLTETVSNSPYATISKCRSTCFGLCVCGGGGGLSPLRVSSLNAVGCARSHIHRCSSLGLLLVVAGQPCCRAFSPSLPPATQVAPHACPTGAAVPRKFQPGPTSVRATAAPGLRCFCVARPTLGMLRTGAGGGGSEMGKEEGERV
jgi:hypothetical protein